MNNWDKKLAQEAMKYGFVPSKPDLYKEEAEQVNEDAATILKHLGGDKFIKKTDAWGWSKSIGKNYLDLQLPDKYLNGINRVKITLDASDTYTVEFGRVSGTTYTVKKEFANVYADQLQNIFTKTTGLYTKL